MSRLDGRAEKTMRKLQLEMVDSGKLENKLFKEEVKKKPLRQNQMG